MKFFLSPLNSKVRSLLNFQKLKQLLGIMLILLAIVFGQTVLAEKFGFSNVVYAQDCSGLGNPCDPNTTPDPCCNFPTNRCIYHAGNRGFFCLPGPPPTWTPTPPPTPTPINTPTPTPLPTPVGGSCGGLDSQNPCQHYDCSGSPSQCQINDGQCINGYCYPKICRYGQSANDCPSSYTCRKSGKCELGFIQCTAGQAKVPCSTKQNCERECGVTTVDCQNSVCVASTSPNPICDSEGGACVDPVTCTGDRKLIGKKDCQGILECCKPIPPQPTIPVYDPTCTAGAGYYGYKGVKSALGCLPTDPQYFVNLATPWAVGIGAGIAFLLGVFGAIMIVLSAGNPEKMQAGKEMITSAIGGLILIIFAVFILRVIGVDILKLF